ncbi:hypothetical protein JCM10212_004193, partial [Sporobolomyces blumeae]
MSTNHRSSADLYASVPTHDSSYPPPTRPSPSGYHDSSERLEAASPRPPPFLNDDSHYPQRRPDSHASFSSDYTYGTNSPNPDQPYRLRGGAGAGASALGYNNASNASGAWDVGYDLTPEGSSANLNQLVGRNERYRDHKEYEGSDSSPTGHGAGLAGSVPALKKRRGGAAGAGGGAGGGWWSRQSSRAKKLLLVGLLIVVIVVAVAVAVPAAVVSNKDKKNNSVSGDSSSNDGTEKGIPTGENPTDWKTAAYGGNGSMIYLENGQSFMYNNSLGGYWVSIPYNDTARAQRDVPALDEEWDYEKNLILGVNIGGWLVLEPFIVPGMFEPFNSNSDSPNSTNNAIDEWTLSEQLGSNLTAAMTEHYETFI